MAAGIPVNVCPLTATWQGDGTSSREWGCGSVDWPGFAQGTGAVAVCRFNEVRRARRWHGNNPALGLELTRRYEDHSAKFFAGVVRDSYGENSAMAGVAGLWPLLKGGRLRVDAGIAGMLWYRTVDDTYARRLVPLALPVLAVSDRETGIGFNASITPATKYRGVQYSVATLMLQMTFQLN